MREAPIERDAWWILEHARHIRDAVQAAHTRPISQAELQRAKDDLTDALEMIAEAQRDCDALPAPVLEAAE
jgi:hypothetical protein